MYRLGIDTGGTFTDAVLLDNQGNIRVFKSSTTPDDFSLGVINCLRDAATELRSELPEFLSKVTVIAHGSTVATNAVLTSSGAKVGSISTKGFRDTLELRRRKRPGEWFRKVKPVEPLCPRYLSLEVDERVRYTGEI
ncbi:MAG: hydantoinase/oxoprolinase N-terminal domain-containing protein, partial [Gammaproteobacteria bacterium]